MNVDNLKCRFAVVKIASRCNLNCTYCYVYNQGDDSYKTQPKVMNIETVKLLGHRIKEHCLKNDITTFTYVIHGGEPLLVGKVFFEDFITKSREIFIDSNINLKFGVQTNGVLLTKEWCELFNRLGISVGISVDGPKEYNDLFRVYHSGKGSFNNILKGINIANQFLNKRIGLLSVINTDIQPRELYELYLSLGISSVDLLLPDGNYDNIPEQLDVKNKSTKHADWMIELFDLWFEDKKNTIKIGFFEKIIMNVLGYDVSSDSMGNKNTDVLVIETNGDIESLDVLKICGNGFTKGNANVLTTSFDEALETPLARMYQLCHSMTSTTCQKCVIKDICGGGYLPHRFSKENKFDNPSIYCENLMKLIVHIQNKVLQSLPKELVDQSSITNLNYQSVLESIN
jgi:uncharacterized protein